MTKSITICISNNLPVDIPVAYSIKYTGNEQMITCSITEADCPRWLQLRNFTLVSLSNKNGFVPIFVEVNNSKNMVTSLFIDHVYIEIMFAENFKVV